MFDVLIKIRDRETAWGDQGRYHFLRGANDINRISIESLLASYRTAKACKRGPACPNSPLRAPWRPK